MPSTSALAVSGSVPGPRGWAEVPVGMDAVVAGAVTLLIGARIPLQYGMELGPLVALLLSPAWVRVVTRYRGSVPVLALIPIAVLSGYLLTAVSTGYPVFRSDMLTRSAMLIGSAGALGGLLWCRSVMGSQRMAVVFGTGLVLGIPFNVSLNENQWRFTYSIPLTILALAVVSLGRRRVWVQLTTCGVLALIGTLNDSRSNSAMLLLAAAVVLWQTIDHGMRRGRGGSVMLVVWAASIYFFVRSAILDGYFGEATLVRTQEQITNAGGSLLLGGRPEIAASAQLIRDHPLGMGSGVGTTYTDLQSAKAAMSGIGYDPNNGYVENFMFGRGIEVHSTLGDYWIWFGLPGLALMALLVWIVGRGVQRMYDSRSLTVLTAYLATRFLWDLGFSPAATSVSLTMLCVAMFLPMRGRAEPSPGPADAIAGQELTAPDRALAGTPRNNGGASNR